jgi:hypothetical protein
LQRAGEFFGFQAYQDYATKWSLVVDKFATAIRNLTGEIVPE